MDLAVRCDAFRQVVGREARVSEGASNLCGMRQKRNIAETFGVPPCTTLPSCAVQRAGMEQHDYALQGASLSVRTSSELGELRPEYQREQRYNAGKNKKQALKL
jgi:hypothetical protein